MPTRRFLRSISAPLTVAATVHAYTLAGKVLEQGTSVPLVGATVTLAGRTGIPAAHSDTVGAFLLTDQATGIATGTSAMAVRLEAGNLVVQGAGADPVQLEVISLSGRRAAIFRQIPSRGKTEFSLAGILGRGVHVLRLRQGSVSRQWTLAEMSGSGGALLSEGTAAGRAMVATGIDTLIVEKPGMQAQRLPLPAGTGTTTTSLDAPVGLGPTLAGRMRFIPEGRVLMGDTLLPDSRPRIWRTVQAFWMDTVPASAADLKAMGFTQNYADGRPGELSWTAAVRYCNARSLAEGLAPAYALTIDSLFWTVRPGAEGYRLPSEAEWEYAARAGTTTPWFWGEDSSLAGQYAEYSRNSPGYPQPVGLLKPNGFGLRDMAGETWEWMEDFFGPYASDETEPVGQPFPYGYNRAYRGGPWFSTETELRSGYRGHDMIFMASNVDVRCVRTAFPKTVVPPWSSFPVSKGQRRIPGGTVRMGDSTQAEGLPFNTRVVKDLWVDTITVFAAEVSKLTGAVVYGDSSKPADLPWYLAVRYCNARSRRDHLDSAYALDGDSTLWKADTTKNGYRLPTEAEWEYLARAGSTGAWWWGNDTSVNTLAPRAWWAGNASGNVQLPALKQPNAFGLYDMAGNSSQWTDDLYGPYNADGSQPVPVMEPYGYHRVYRGGAWFSTVDGLRVGRRKHDLGLASGYIGFRCVRTAD